MRRNISSELIVALLAAVSFLFAAAFAVLLSTSTSQRPTIQQTAAAVPTTTSTVSEVSLRPATATETPMPEDVTREPIVSETPVPQPIAATGTAPAVNATSDLSLSWTPTMATVTQLPVATQTSITRIEIAPANLTLTVDPRNGGRPGGALDCASSDDFGNDACRYG